MLLRNVITRFTNFTFIYLVFGYNLQSSYPYKESTLYHGPSSTVHISGKPRKKKKSILYRL